jgi:glutathione synthetase
MQLSGMKKIQQLLTKKEVLADFVSEEISGSFLKTFAKMHTLDEIINTHEGKVRADEWLSNHPDDYVLKPQREGGGNNYFGTDILKILPTIKKEEQKAYIMMEKIQAVPHSSLQVVNEQAETLNCVSEIGRYGICFAENGEVKNNLDAGYLVRTKAKYVNEGGVCAGFACLNTIARFD